MLVKLVLDAVPKETESDEKAFTDSIDRRKNAARTSGRPSLGQRLTLRARQAQWTLNGGDQGSTRASDAASRRGSDEKAKRGRSATVTLLSTDAGCAVTLLVHL